MGYHQNLLDQILKCTPDCVFTLDRDWHFSFLNVKAVQTIGGSRPLLGMHVLDAFPLLRETGIWAAYERAMDRHISQCLETLIPGLNGWFNIRVAPIAEGIAVFFSSVDIRKKQHVALEESQDVLRKTLDQIPQMVWTADGDGKFESFNAFWYFFTGLTPDFMSSAEKIDVFHPDDRDSVIRKWFAALSAGCIYEDQYRLKHHGDGWRWVMSRAWPEKDGFGKVVRWYGTCTDIHEQTIAKRNLQDRETLFRSVLEASADCIKIMTADGRLDFMNEPGCRLLELGSFEDVRGRDWAELWPQEMQKQVTDAIISAANGTSVRFTGRCPTATGQTKWWDSVVTPITDSDGLVTSILSISRDVTHERERSHQLEWASEHDVLTELPNRRTFNARLQAAVLRSMKSKNQLGLLFIDLDYFKHVNDSLGHAAGDQLLCSFANRLNAAIGDKNFAARLGGDEFAVIIEDLAEPENLVECGASILAALSEPIKAGAHFVRASASIGASLYPRDAHSAAELMTCADTALYALKEAGRGGTKVFEAELSREVQRAASELRLGRAAVNGNLILPFYQPKVELRSGRIVGFEALLRWGNRGSPMQLPCTVAESFKNYELSAQLGEAMQRQVFEDMAQGLLLIGSEDHVAINAAPAEFLRDDYAERLLELMGSSGVKPRSIQVEVTEHVFLERHSGLVRRALRVLHEHGVRIALDDFGTGYSSLTHLRDFPVDVLKIDLSFVQHMCRQREIHAIVSAVIDLADNLDIEVVAEGIETKEQLDELLRLGCGFGQGYLFGHPAPLNWIPSSPGGSREAA